MDSEDEAPTAPGMPGLPGMPAALPGLGAITGGAGAVAAGAGALGALPGAGGALGAMGAALPAIGGIAGAGGPTGQLSAPLQEKMESAIAKTGAVTALAKGADGGGDDKAEEESQPLLARFFVKEQARECKAIFLPDGTRFGQEKLKDLFEKNWKDDFEEMPTTLIDCDSGMVHPGDFGGEKLVTLPNFSKPWRNAVKHAGRALPDGDEKAKKDFAHIVINDVIFLKLKTVFASLIDAASIAKNWIIINRCGYPSPNGPPIGGSPSSEILLEAALRQTDNRPTIIVLDSFCRLKLFTSKEATECINTMETIKADKSVSKIFGTDDALGGGGVGKPIPQFYDYSAFSDYNASEFDELWKAPDMEMPCQPLSNHKEPGGGGVMTRFKWLYPYQQTFYASGTHYFIMDSKHDAPDLSALADQGFVCANGQGIMYDRLKGLIQQGKKLVMLHNTGGVVQAFCSLQKKMLSNTTTPEPKDILAAVELVSPQPWAKNFGLPEVMMMRELHARAPMLFKETVVYVNLMEDDSATVLEILTNCFAGSGGIPELGLGDAEKICVLTAWKRHMTLFESKADRLQLLLYGLAVVTTAVSVTYSMENAALALAAAGTERMLSEEEESSLPFPDLSAQGYTILLLPILLALVSTIVDQIYKYRLRTDLYDTKKPPPPDKDGNIPVIAPSIREQNARKTFVETVGKIYSAAISQEVAKGGALAMNKKWGKLQIQAGAQHDQERDEFTSKYLKDHITDKLHSSQDYLAKGGGKGGGKSGGKGKSVEDKAKDMPKKAATDALKKHRGMLGGLLGGRAAKVAAAAAEGMAEDMAEGAMEDALTDAMGAGTSAPAEDDGGGDADAMLLDDFVTQLDIETYIACRVRPVAKHLEQRAQVLAKRNQCAMELDKRETLHVPSLLEFAVVSINTGSAVMSVVGLADYISISTSVASQCLAIQDYFYIPAQLSATNTALENVHNLLTWWDSLSLVQRKTRPVKERCAQTLEGALLDICNAQTTQPVALPGTGEEGGEES